MLSNLLKSSKIYLKYFSKTASQPNAAAPFATWHPNIPRHEVRIDKSGYNMAHPLWDLREAENIQFTHYEPKNRRDRIALSITQFLRKGFDYISGFKRGKADEVHYLRRYIFLGSLSGVPGMIGAMIRHMRSLGHLNHDCGRIHYLLKEAENERIHFFVFLNMRQPGYLFRTAMLMSQALFIFAYSMFYWASQRGAHRFAGYMKEEAIKNFTDCIRDIDEGNLPLWANRKAPEEAIKYYSLNENAKLRDVLLAIRADEVLHREMNHYFADLNPYDPVENFLRPGSDPTKEKKPRSQGEK